MHERTVPSRSRKKKTNVGVDVQIVGFGIDKSLARRFLNERAANTIDLDDDVQMAELEAKGGQGAKLAQIMAVRGRPKRHRITRASNMTRFRRTDAEIVLGRHDDADSTSLANEESQCSSSSLQSDSRDTYVRRAHDAELRALMSSRIAQASQERARPVEGDLVLMQVQIARLHERLHAAELRIEDLMRNELL